MKQLLVPVVALALHAVPANHAQAESSWSPVGLNDESISSAWAQLGSYKPYFNEYSFRVNARLYKERTEEGRLDVNCNAKDYFFDRKDHVFQISRWRPIATNSAIETVAKYFCGRTDAKTSWGYTSERAYLWNQPEPRSSGKMADVKWIKSYGNDGNEMFYNPKIERKERFIQVQVLTPSRGRGQSGGDVADARQSWLNISCENSMFSNYLKPDEATPGIWESPTVAIPGSIAFHLRNQYCQ